MHYAYNTDTTDEVPDGVLVDVTLFDTNRVLYRYDYLQRQSNKIIKEKPGQNESVEDKRTILEETYAYAPGTGENTTTTRVSTKRVFWNNTRIHQFQHGYDALGNITNIYDAVTLKRVNYTYDDQGQLKKAVHIEDGSVTRTETYSYDNVGNITEFNNGTTSHTYTYGDTQWKDLLTKVDGNTINYDASGNPTEYYNNWTMTWAEGRRLESVTVGGQTYTYLYNADGQRVKKTNPDGSYVEYYVMNGITVGERRYSADKTTFQNIRYTLDENNSVIGISVSTGSGWDNYYFAKNLQGDVLEVYNASTNEVVAQYTYDSWGNILTATGSMAETNPFRYRGYYYDRETNFYYLQSRYYDAAIGRFINADALSSTGQGSLGYNLFVYCLNNPVMMKDSDGQRAMINTRGSGYLDGKRNTHYYSDGNGRSDSLLEYYRVKDSSLCGYPDYEMRVYYQGRQPKETDHSMDYAYFILKEAASAAVVDVCPIAGLIMAVYSWYSTAVSIDDRELFPDGHYDTYIITMQWTDIYEWDGGTTYTHYSYEYVICWDTVSYTEPCWQVHTATNNTSSQVVLN